MRPRLAGEFIAGRAGPLAVVSWEPPPGAPIRFAVLHVPAALEEMNKSRRMVALQARALANLGGVVAIVDPRGTGDSAGTHALASWEGWREDVVSAWQWLRERVTRPSLLWGSRLGALLAVDLEARGAVDPSMLLLWQPVSSGRGFFNQFLRLAAVSQMGEAGERKSPSTRERLDAGEPVEVAGYVIDPALVAGADASELAPLSPRVPVMWRETTIATPADLAPVSSKVVARWRSEGVDVDAAAVCGSSFWASQEIAEAPQLIESTTRGVAQFVERLVGVIA